MEVKAPSKGIKELCAKLGSDYSIKVFDFENVIYRNLGNGYDIEVSRLDNNKKTMNATIYVWKMDPPQVIDTIRNINSFESLEQTLSDIVSKYSAR